MKRKLLLAVLLMLTVCTARSQDTIADSPPDSLDLRPVSFPFWIVHQIALDLEEKSRLEQEVELLLLEKSSYRLLVTGLEQKDQERRLQLELLEKNQELLKVQLKAEEETKRGEPWLLWALRLLGALGAGFVLGRI